MKSESPELRHSPGRQHDYSLSAADMKSIRPLGAAASALRPTKNGALFKPAVGGAILEVCADTREVGIDGREEVANQLTQRTGDLPPGLSLLSLIFGGCGRFQWVPKSLF